MSITTNAPLAIMNKKPIAICITLVFAAIFSASPANAKLATTLTSTEIIITSNSYYEPEAIILDCGDGSSESFHYRQRVVINGITTIVLTEFVYPAGTHKMYFEYTCGGYNIYSATTCACITTGYQDPGPKLDLKTSSADVQDFAKEVIGGEHNDLERTTSPSSLWIRKKE